MATSTSLGIVAAGIAGAVTWFAVDQNGKTPPLSALVADVDARLREASAAARTRAETLSELPRLQVAVATDERTVRDLNTEELAFRPRPGEQIEIAQIPIGAGKEGAGGEPLSMLRVPDEHLALPVAAAGQHAVVASDGLRLVAVEPITPRARADELRGAIAVARLVDLSDLAPRLKKMGLAGELRLAAGAVRLGGADARGGEVTNFPMQGTWQESLTLSLTGSPQASSLPLHLIGPVMMLLASLTTAFVVKRRPPVGPPPAPPAEPIVPPPVALDARMPVPTHVAGTVQVAGEVRGGGETDPEVVTPPPVPEPELEPDESTKTVEGMLFQLGVASPSEASDAAGARPGLHKLPSELFEGDSLPATMGPVAEDPMLDAEYRALFKEFVQLRATCRERTDNLDEDRFVRVLRWQHAAVREEHRTDQVSFRLSFDNGRAAIHCVLAGEPPPTPGTTA